MTRSAPVRVLPARTAAALRRQGYTYAPVGGTRGELPPGFDHLRRSRVIGHGGRAFDAATQAVLSWQVQRGAGIRIEASCPVATEGTLVVLHLGHRPVAIAAPARVVHVVDEDTRRGFAYGTLPGHPESGEECFLVEQRTDGAVTFTVTAYSRAGSLLTRAAGPANRAFQRFMADRYLRTLRRLVAAEDPALHPARDR